MSCRIAVLAVAVVVGLGLVAAPAAASDKTTAKQLVITAADAGSAFTASKPSQNPDRSAQIAACVGKPVSKRVVTAHLQGPDLTNSQDGSAIESSVDFVKTTTMAKADRSVLSDSKFANCLARVASAQLRSQGVTNVSAQRVNVKPYGTYSTAIESRITGTSNGQPLNLTLVQVGILKGRAELMASFVTNGDQPFDQTQGQTILDNVNKRLKKAKT